MRVNVFVARNDGKTPHDLLVLPYGPLGGIPQYLMHLDWRNLATTMSDNKMLGRSAAAIEEDIALCGYALVPTTGSIVAQRQTSPSSVSAEARARWVFSREASTLR